MTSGVRHQARGLGPRAALILRGPAGPADDYLPPALDAAVSDRRERAALAAYGAAVTGAREELEGVDAEYLVDAAQEIALESGQTDALQVVVDQLFHALARWSEELSGLGEHLAWLCPAGLPQWAADFGRAEATVLNHAGVVLLRAITEVHHGRRPDPAATDWWSAAPVPRPARPSEALFAGMSARRVGDQQPYERRIAADCSSAGVSECVPPRTA
ncbi:hypothetical protein ACFC58_06800 [Kitasatospora purpeofusca]|uniref:hypothetical protein n=1 Tax=Kitasatospora purpeofusca TaxID=67352 RepID=UPI0035D8761A